jgi:glycosyltransferase involved in cell wall biosynthesis
MKIMRPNISIVVPTYRRPETLRRALESISSAVSTSYEVIVVDDCPEATGAAVAKHFNARYVHKAGIDRGLSVSRNIGIELSRGHMLAFLDDDDFFLPGGVDRLLGGVSVGGAGVVFGDYQTFNSIRREEVSLGTVTLNVLLVCNQIPVGAYAIARHAIVRNFDTRMRSHEDWDFLLSSISEYGMAHVAGSVVAIVKTENQTTSMQARRRKLFWLDFFSIYAKFPARHLSKAREAMLASLGVQLPDGLLQNDDQI